MKTEVAANSAHLHCSIRGTSLVTGKAALYQAREVAQLVESLKSGGVQDSEIHLHSVSVENEGGVITRSSAARYGLTVECSDLTRLAGIIGAVTSQKNVTLSGIEWRYPPVQDYYDDLLAKCLREAERKAGLVSGGLGVSLLGVHRFTEKLEDRTEHVEMFGVFVGLANRRRSLPVEEEIGTMLSHAKEVKLQVTVEYATAPYDTAKGTS